MNDLHKAAEMALTALRNAEVVYMEQLNAMYALQEALAQQEQEPFGYFRYDLEWDGWVETESDDGKPLYTSPPKREWVGLTDEEAWGVYRTHGLSFHRPNHVEEYEWAFCIRDFARDIETKLKEKNT